MSGEERRKTSGETKRCGRAAPTLQKPVILIGAARSGTKMLAELLNRHPDLFVLREPTAVWRYGRAYSRTDLRPPTDATEKTRAYIRRAFAEALRESGKPRFAEKTPSNCMRIPFIDRVFPDAQFVHIVRDGRDAAASAVEVWRGLRDQPVAKPRGETNAKRPAGNLRWVAQFWKRAFRRKMRVDDLRSFIELPAYLPWAAAIARRHLFNSSKPLWGPRIPGLRQIRSALPLLETCALQWDMCVRTAASAARQLDPSRYFELRYERLVNSAAETTAETLRFLNLPFDDERLRLMTSHIRPYPLPRWREKLSAEELRRVEALIGAGLEQMGYPLAADA